MIYTDQLNREGVSIVTKNILGELHRVAYANSSSGRSTIAIEQPPEITEEVMKVWGDAPTVLDEQPMPAPPPILPSPLDILGAQVAQLSIDNIQKDQIINALGAQLTQTSLDVMELKNAGGV